MKKHVPFFASAIAIACTFASLFFSSCTAKRGDKTLYLFGWTYYIPDAVVKQFEEEFDANVWIDSYASNEEMFAKLLAGAASYDIVFPSQDYASIMIKLGMLKKIDLTKVPNAQNISPAVLEKAVYDPAMEYCVPYYMGAAGVAVNKTKVERYEKSWNIFARTDLKDRMCMMDDMREVIGDALAFDGKSVNSLNDADLAQAERLIIDKWKPNLVKFDAEGFGKSFASNDFWVVQGYAEAVFGEVPEDKWHTVDFFIPEEGGPMYIDSMCVLKGARNYDLALEFINFIHRPEIYAQFLDSFHFPASVNPKAAQFTTTTPFYSADELANCQIKEDLAGGLAKYNAVWQRIRFTE